MKNKVDQQQAIQALQAWSSGRGTATPTSETKEALRSSIRQKVKERHDRLNKYVGVPTMPEGLHSIRIACIGYYIRNDIWFSPIKHEVDLFIQDVLKLLKQHGLESAEVEMSVRDLIIVGMSTAPDELCVCRHHASDHLGHTCAACHCRHFRSDSKPCRESMLQYSVGPDRAQRGTPYLAGVLESLLYLDSTLAHVASLEEDDPSYAVLLSHAEKMLRDLVKSLARPATGMSLAARHEKVKSYSALITGGWTRPEASVKRPTRPIHAKNKEVQPEKPSEKPQGPLDVLVRPA